MARTLDDTLRVLKGRMKGPGADHARLFGALEAHYASEVAQDLARMREQAAISQAELGRRAHVPPAEISRILSGQRDPRASTPTRLAPAMGAQLRIVSSAPPRT